VSYVHLEFDAHQVIFAEGAQAESFADDASRELFDNAAEYFMRFGREPQAAAPVFCAPRVEEGPELEGIRQRLARRAICLDATRRALQLGMTRSMDAVLP
jgi:hypothetical protein